MPGDSIKRTCRFYYKKRASKISGAFWAYWGLSQAKWTDLNFFRSILAPPWSVPIDKRGQVVFIFCAVCCFKIKLLLLLMSERSFNWMPYQHLPQAAFSLLAPPPRPKAGVSWWTTTPVFSSHCDLIWAEVSCIGQPPSLILKNKEELYKRNDNKQLARAREERFEIKGF